MAAILSPRPGPIVHEPETDLTAVLDRARDLVCTTLDELSEQLTAASGNVEVAAKPDGTPVTAMDHEVDRQLARTITAAFPGHGLISEEHQTVAPDREWTWIVDPIDGTSNFTAGVPWWCISVALAHEGVPVLGIVDAPALARRYVAIQGHGAYRGGQRLHVRTPVDWRASGHGHLPVMLTTGTARRSRAAGLRLSPRVMGSTALDLAVVADGTAVAAVAVAPRIWDVAAGMVLVQEAGGAVVTPTGPAWTPLTPGIDHQQVATTTAAAGDEGYATRLVETLFAQR